MPTQEAFVHFDKVNVFVEKNYPGGVDGDGELHEGPGPDDQHHHAQDLVRVHFVVLWLNTGIIELIFTLI